MLIYFFFSFSSPFCLEDVERGGESRCNWWTGLSTCLSTPASQSASNDDLIVFLVNYALVVLHPSPSLPTLRVMIGGRSVPSGKDETPPPTHTHTHFHSSLFSPPSLLAVLFNVSIFPHPLTYALSHSCPLSFSLACWYHSHLSSLGLTSWLPVVWQDMLSSYTSGLFSNPKA